MFLYLAMLGLAIAGILAIVRGRLTISRTKVVTGIPARLLGVLALTPFPLALVVAGVYTVANVDLGDEQKAQAWIQDQKVAFAVIEVGSLVLVGIAFFVIGAMIGKAPAVADSEIRRRKNVQYDDYEDERPRRKREYDDEEDERPRRKREDLHDEGPRRQRDSDDDERPRRRRDED